MVLPVREALVREYEEIYWTYSGPLHEGKLEWQAGLALSMPHDVRFFIPLLDNVDLPQFVDISRHPAIRY